MYLMIDNYDSFVYNLSRYLEENGEEVKIIRNDHVTAADVEAMLDSGSLRGVIVSPGPKAPSDCGNSLEIVTALAGRVPILGVCLGHQIIGHAFGAKVVKGARPMHGKVTEIHTNQTGLFTDLPQTYRVTRYHSLVVSEEDFPNVLSVDARADDGTIQAMHHKELPVYGVQFHPEAVLTEYGHELLKNFTTICERWWQSHENKTV